MRFRIHTAAVVAAFALCGTAFGQAKPEASIHKLRNIAAADAASALNAFVEKKQLPVAVVAEPITNIVVLAGGAASVRQVSDLLASLDKEPPSIVATMIILEAPKGFAEDIGLGEETETKWVLSPRETRMLTAAIRHGKGRSEIDILSRPQMQLTDNQTGNVEVGNMDADRLTASLTPRIGSDGAVTLRVETEVKRKSDGTVRATAKVADGGTLVMRGAQSKTDEGGMRERYVIVTVNVLKTARR